MPACAQSRETGGETVFLLPFVVDSQVLGVLPAETLAHRVGGKTIGVLAEVAQQRYTPIAFRMAFLARRPCNIGLIINKVRLIITRRGE